MHLRRISIVVLIMLGCLALQIHPARGAGKITPELRALLDGLAPEHEVAVIATLTDKVDPHRFRDTDRRIRRRHLLRALKNKAATSHEKIKVFLRQRGIGKIKALLAANALAFRAPAGLVRQLADRPEFARINHDYILTVPEASVAAAAPEWNLASVRADELWALGVNGQGIVVANMDTGVDRNHPDLFDSWRAGTNSWKDIHGDYLTPVDDNGHGTQTMGIMVGGAAGGTAIGMAPGAQWIAVRVFDSSGQAPLSDIHQGFDWILDPDGSDATDDAPDIVNNSWGYPQSVNDCFTEFTNDIEVLKAAGIGVVFSAGNEGPFTNTSVSPADNAGSFAVGAVGQNLVVTGFSSRGPSACDASIFPHLVAPGAQIYTTDIYSVPDNPRYVSLDGTSFAAPHAAGAMALLMGAFPGVSLQRLEDALVLSALDLGTPGPDNNYGAGLLDVMQAYTLLQQQTGSNQNPLAADQNIATANNKPVQIMLGATDADGDPLTYAHSLPANGTLTGTAPGLVYTPDSGFTGEVFFTFSAHDGFADSNVATVTINVTDAVASVGFIYPILLLLLDEPR